MGLILLCSHWINKSTNKKEVNLFMLLLIRYKLLHTERFFSSTNYTFASIAEVRVPLIPIGAVA